MPAKERHDPEANKALVRRFVDELDGLGAQQAVDHCATADFVVHFPRGLSPEPLQRSVYVAAAVGIRAAFPDMRHAIEEISAEGDRVWYRGTNRGTHRGEFQGVAPTGNRVAFGVICESRIQDGRIAEMWLEVDAIGWMQQLGVQLLPVRGS
ncbi:MAG: ester cyclase [Candidatus Latescibacterota bacterium]